MTAYDSTMPGLTGYRLPGDPLPICRVCKKPITKEQMRARNQRVHSGECRSVVDAERKQRQREKKRGA